MRWVSLSFTNDLIVLRHYILYCLSLSPHISSLVFRLFDLLMIAAMKFWMSRMHMWHECCVCMYEWVMPVLTCISEDPHSESIDRHLILCFLPHADASSARKSHSLTPGSPFFVPFSSFSYRETTWWRLKSTKKHSIATLKQFKWMDVMRSSIAIGKRHETNKHFDRVITFFWCA